MTNYRRNVLVGLTVLLGLLILGWMIVQFGEGIATPFAEETIPVTFVADRADGVGAGSPILLRGYNVGRVTGVRPMADWEQIRIEAQVATDPPVPANVVGEIRATSFVGSGSAISLVMPAGEASSGQTLSAGAELEARYVGLELLPEGVSEVAEESRVALARFNELGVLDNVNDKITRVGGVLSRAEALLGDEQFTGDLRATAANARAGTESFRQVGETAQAMVVRVDGRIDPIVADVAETAATAKQAVATANQTAGEARALVGRANERLAEAGEAMDKVNAILTKVDKGEGTAGLLVNDPKAYEALVDSLRILQGTLADAQRVVQQIEQEGFKVGL